jgi:nucleotide-binding universal stress UspA family protein
VFSHTAFSIWIWIAVTWVIGSAIVIVIIPLIEGKVGITQVLKMISLTFLVKLRPNPNPESKYDILDYTEKQNQRYFENTKRILVPIEGSLQSLKTLNGAVSLFNDAARTRIFALNVTEWTDEDESLDGEMTSKIEEEGRRMLRSVAISTKKETFERIVKVGDPSSKIVELAKILEIELIMMGSTGIGNSDQDLGHVTRC